MLESSRKLFFVLFQGSYRKFIVDDSIPCDENMKPLLPFATRQNELWPLIITKALIKVASLEYVFVILNFVCARWICKLWLT